jgi:hypothetical protein
MPDIGRLRDLVDGVLAELRTEQRADPADYGFDDEAVERLLADARGDTVTRERLLGPNAEVPVIDHLEAGEQPHHLVPGSEFAVEMDGEEMTARSGYLVVTDERVLYLLYAGLTVSRNEVRYGQIEAIERDDGGDRRELTLRTERRELRMATPADDWGSELEAAVDELRERRPRRR